MIKHVIIDTETTGLDPLVHDVIQFGGVVMIGGKITEKIEFRIHPRNILAADPKALEINGYTPGRWKRAHHSHRGAEMVQWFLTRHADGVIVGHNLEFDLSFLAQLGEREGMAIEAGHKRIDTMHIVRAALCPMGLHSTSLEAVCTFLGWERRKAHSALSDCEDCARLLLNLCPPSAIFMLRLWLEQRIKRIWRIK